MRFEKPVRVAVTPLGNVAKLVEDPAGAADVLLYRWHGPDDARSRARHLAARRAVLAALESANDHVKTERARKAFVAAADAAGLLMPDMVRPKPIPGFKSPDWSRPKRKLKRDR